MTTIPVIVALVVARLLTLGPVDASIVAARILGAPGWTSEVLDILDVESRGVAVGIHRGGARRRSGASFWRQAVAAGELAPRRCEAHRRGDGERWGVRGPYGLVAAYSVRHLGECVAPELLDVPVISAVVVVRRLEILERKYGLKTRQARAHVWRHGVGCRCRRAR